jgi:hypothetical protein
VDQSSPDEAQVQEASAEEKLSKLVLSMLEQDKWKKCDAV